MYAILGVQAVLRVVCILMAQNLSHPNPSVKVHDVKFTFGCEIWFVTFIALWPKFEYIKIAFRQHLL